MSGWRREGCRITASPDLNPLFPASANLFATMANKINERGQISGMAIVLSGGCRKGVDVARIRLKIQPRGRFLVFHDPLSPRSDLRGEVFRLVKKGWRSVVAMWLIPEARTMLDLRVNRL